MLPVVGYNEAKFRFISGVRTSLKWNWKKTLKQLKQSAFTLFYFRRSHIDRRQFCFISVLFHDVRRAVNS